MINQVGLRKMLRQKLDYWHFTIVSKKKTAEAFLGMLRLFSFYLILNEFILVPFLSNKIVLLAGAKGSIWEV